MPEKVKWTRKDLLGLEDLSREEIKLILDTALSFKEVSERSVKKVPALRGKTVVNLFFESSTRTRTSFELAAKQARSIAKVADGVIIGSALVKMIGQKNNLIPRISYAAKNLARAIHGA